LTEIRKPAFIGVMRVLSFILIALGLYLLGSAYYDEYRGSTFKPAALRGGRAGPSFNRGYLYSIPVSREQNPELFRRFMVKHWIYAVVVEAAGCILYMKSKRVDDL
jgi:hypothetical protein